MLESSIQVQTIGHLAGQGCHMIGQWLPPPCARCMAMQPTTLASHAAHVQGDVICLVIAACCLQRRFPKGLKVHVHSLDRFGCLAALTRVLHQVRPCQARSLLSCSTCTRALSCQALHATCLPSPH